MSSNVSNTPNQENDTFSIILIPWEEVKPIQTIDIPYAKKTSTTNSPADSSSHHGNAAGNLAGAFAGGKDQIMQHLYTFIDKNQVQIEAMPLKRMSPTSTIIDTYNPNDDKEEALIHASGIYAYHCVNTDTNPTFANIRATSLSMACGLLSQRFYGDVFVARLGYFPYCDNSNSLNEICFMMNNRSISIDEIKYAAYVSPDLRTDVIQALIPNNEQKEETQKQKEDIIIPLWLADAAKSNYEDAAALSILAQTMNKKKDEEEEEEKLEEIKEDESDDDEEGNVGDHKTEKNSKTSKTTDIPSKTKSSKSYVVRTPLCIHCRRPCKTLCSNCEGVYFCSEQCQSAG